MFLVIYIFYIVTVVTLEATVFLETRVRVVILKASHNRIILKASQSRFEGDYSHF